MSGGRRRTSHRNTVTSNSAARPRSQAADSRSQQVSSHMAMQNLHALLQTNQAPTPLGHAVGIHSSHGSSQVAMDNLQRILQANQSTAAVGLLQANLERAVGTAESSITRGGVQQLRTRQGQLGVSVGSLPSMTSPAFPQNTAFAQSQLDDARNRSQQVHVPTSAVEAEPFVSRIRGPCYCKMLVPDHVAGALIGKEGSMIGEIEMISGCTLQISAKKSYFPGTRDRIVLIGGLMEEVQEGIVLVQQRLRESSHQKHNYILCKLAVPRSAISGLIGREGRLIRSLSIEYGCTINISARVQECEERIVLISGDVENVQNATSGIVFRLQEDPNIQDHLTLTYSYELPLGTWDRSTQPESEVALISPRTARTMFKGDIIEYLRKIAPRELLLRRNLLGDIKNTKKSQGLEDLVAAVSEVWTFYHGGLTEEDTYMAQMLLPTPESAADSASNTMSAATTSTAPKYGNPSWIMEVAQQPRTLVVPKLPSYMHRERRTHINPLPLPLPVGQLEPGTALRATRGMTKASELSETEDARSEQRHEQRVLTAMALLQEDSDLETIFCGPPSEPDESGKWLDEEVDSYLPIGRTRDDGLTHDPELSHDEGRALEQESLGKSAEAQNQSYMHEQQVERQSENLNSEGQNNDVFPEGPTHSSTTARSKRRVSAKPKPVATHRNESQTHMDLRPPPGLYAPRRTVSPTVAGFTLQAENVGEWYPQTQARRSRMSSALPQEDPMQPECVRFLYHLFGVDTSCYPAWYSFVVHKHAHGNLDPSCHSSTFLREFLRSYCGEEPRLHSLLQQWGSSQQPREASTAGFSFDAHGRGRLPYTFPHEVVSGSVQVTLPVGSEITISLQEAASAAAQPSTQSITPSVEMHRQVLPRDFRLPSRFEGVPSASGGTGSTEDTSVDDPRRGEPNVSNYTIASIPSSETATEHALRQFTALSRQLAQHGTPPEVHPRITVGQRVLDFYAEGGQIPQQPFSQSPLRTSSASRPVGLQSTRLSRNVNSLVESFEEFSEAAARRDSF